IGRRKADRRLERKVALAGTEFALDGAQRQIEGEDLPPHDFEDWLDLIETRFRQILIALRQQADSRRLARPSGIARGEARIVELENVKLDFEAGYVVEPGIGEPLQHPAIKVPRRERHRLPVGKINVA